MTKFENEQYRKLERKLYRGLTFSEWEVLIPLRTKFLIAKGENPAHWDLNSRHLSRKLHYRQY